MPGFVVVDWTEHVTYTNGWQQLRHAYRKGLASGYFTIYRREGYDYMRECEERDRIAAAKKAATDTTDTPF